MGTNSVPLVADLVLFCYDKDFILSLSEDSRFKLSKLSILLFGIWMTIGY